MTAIPKHGSPGLASVTLKRETSAQLQRMKRRFREQDVEFTRQSKRLAKMVNRLKHDITRKLS